jgi:hypothetical protein
MLGTFCLAKPIRICLKGMNCAVLERGNLRAVRNGTVSEFPSEAQASRPFKQILA